MHPIAIILPAYNEELTIKDTIEAFYKELPEAHFVVVDNNSSDNTSKIVKEVFNSLNIKATLLFEKRQGKGNAIRQAFSKIDAKIYIMSDADMTYPAYQVHKLIQKQSDTQCDMVVGDRLSQGLYKHENKRSFHNFGNSLVKTLINKLFKTNLDDIMSGYRLFARRFAKNYPILIDGFELETDMTLHALDKRFHIEEVSIEYKDRPEGSFSKLSTFSDGAKVLFTIMQIFRYYRPFLFFGTIAILLTFLSLLSAIPVLNDWFEYKYIYHVPLAILSTGLGIVAVLSFALGLILDAIAHLHKMDFENKII
jgi:glycosyltransferase involved in cell wall biosynthesis